MNSTSSKVGYTSYISETGNSSTGLVNMVELDSIRDGLYIGCIKPNISVDPLLANKFTIINFYDNNTSNILLDGVTNIKLYGGLNIKYSDFMNTYSKVRDLMSRKYLLLCCDGDTKCFNLIISMIISFISEKCNVTSTDVLLKINDRICINDKWLRKDNSKLVNIVNNFCENNKRSVESRLFCNTTKRKMGPVC